MLTYTVSENDARQRLDTFLAKQLPDLSRALIKRYIDDGSVTLGGEQVKAGTKLKDNDQITVNVDIESIDDIPDIDLPVLYEDDDVLVIDKPEGVISHSRGRYWNEPSVASFVRQKTKQDGERAGIVHRLDRATSGVMICAKNETAMKWLQTQFSKRKVKKTYIAVVSGHMDPPKALIDLPIERNPKQPQQFRVGSNGKESQTEYTVQEEGDSRTLLQLTPQTGRTHQIRVHLAYVGHPIVGDALYSGEPAERLLLHAHKLEITLPNKTRTTFTSPTPEIFSTFLNES